MSKISKMSVQAIEALAKKNLLQWVQVKEAISLGSKLSQEKLLALKPSKLALEVATLKATKKS